jgi:hypothetical protein
MDVSEETGKFTEELVPSAGSGTLVISEELDSSELSLESVSAALADEESSPQATMPAPTRAQKQKARAWSLMQYNIPKNEMQNLSHLVS